MVTVTGTGSTWTSDGLVFGDAALSIGESGTGVLTITDGGVVSTTGPTTIGSGGTLQFDGLSPLHTGSLTVNGGTLRTLGAAAFTSPATLGAGGMTVDSDGFDSNFIGNFSGVGGITKVGMGTLTLMSASSYTGATAVNAGTLALVTPYASLGNTAITVAQGATFAVNGGFGPSESAAAPMAPPAGVVATINPGPPQIVNAGTTGSGTAGATLTLKPGSAFTIGGASGIAPILIFGIGNENAGTDLINVTKTVSLLATGGEIAIDPLAGDTSLTAGNYDLITSAGGFSGVGGNGFTLSDPTDVIDGTTYDFSLADSSTTAEVLTVSVAASPDIAPESAEGFARVPERQGVTPLAATAAVPEPGATMSLLLALGVAGGWILRRGRD
jgi:fibronectin-binding autotransporter adhesin